MPILILSLFRFVRLLLSGHGAVAMENAALRVQLVAFQRKPKRPALTSFDRLFWVGLSLLWTGWRAPLVYVRADTVVRWQRERFRRFWPPGYLLRDRDGVYGSDVRSRIASLQIEEVLTAPRSPWQNPYAKRLIGSIRRECLDHFIILNARHLKRTLASYFNYYHESRTHLGLDKQCPFPRQVSAAGQIVQIPQLGGLHHRYERLAA